MTAGPALAAAWAVVGLLAAAGVAFLVADRRDAALARRVRPDRGVASARGTVPRAAATARAHAALSRRRRRRGSVDPATVAVLARSVADTMAAGRSLPAALAIAERDVDGPLATWLRSVTTRLAVGEDVLRTLDRDRTTAGDHVDLLVATLAVQYRAGGDLVRTLRDLAAVMDARQSLHDEVETLLTSARSAGNLTALLGVGTVALLAYLRPGALAALVTDDLGRVAVLVALVLYGAAFLAMRRVARVPT